VKVPQELLRSTPRHVGLTASGRAVAVLAVCLLAAAIIASAVLLAASRRDAVRERAALSTDGRIVALSSSRGENPRWIATYVYVIGGRGYQGTSPLGRQRRQKVSVGDGIVIRYLPSDPLTSWVSGYGSSPIPIVVAPLTFAGLALPGIAALMGVRRQTRLLSYGQTSVARVTASRKAGKGARRVSYQYALLSGATRTSAIEIEKNPPAVGSEMILVYDPDNPRRRARYPLPLVRCAAPY
jgi:hypothetical protein